MSDPIVVPMDPESNWDICPVCRHWLSEQDEFPGIEAMRERHEAHKRAHIDSKGANDVDHVARESFANTQTELVFEPRGGKG